MSSILTNTASMVALQTLRGVNMNLAKAQGQISTGMKIANAKDNSSIWAISKVMQSDVKGFKGISESLGLGESTVGVARSASETISDLLTDIKGKIVAAQEENVDRTKIQTDIDALTDQIKSVVDAAQFNGLNLLKGTVSVNILSSLNRSGSGAVSATNITVARQDLTTDSGTVNTSGIDISAQATVSAATVDATAITEIVTVVAGDGDYSDETLSLTIGTQTITYGVGDLTGDATAVGGTVASAINALGIEGVTAISVAGVITLSSTNAFDSFAVSATGTNPPTVGTGTLGARAESVTFAGGVSEGDGYQVTVGTNVFSYVAGNGENFEDVVNGLKAVVDGANMTGMKTGVAQNSTGDWQFLIDNDNATVVALAIAGFTGGTSSGGLIGLDAIDVSTNAGADAALQNVEAMINSAINAAAEFGSAQGRIQIQRDFISELTDSLKAGIGTLIDADMEEASARLQALQVQQQLGIQSLSIANQSPQSILSLFQ